MNEFHSMLSNTYLFDKFALFTFAPDFFPNLYQCPEDLSATRSCSNGL